MQAALASGVMGETQQRVRRVGVLKKKPNAFHILDAMRAVAMACGSRDVEEALAQEAQLLLLDRFAWPAR